MFPCVIANDLPEVSFYAGDYKEFTFNIYNSGSSALDISTATCTWKLSPYGSGSAVLTISGSLTGSPVNRFVVVLNSSDTLNLSGKFMQQPIIQDINGNFFRPSQGIVNIWKAIQ